jgi:hypothetical protein
MSNVTLNSIILNIWSELGDIFILCVDDETMGLIFGIMGIVAWSAMFGVVGYFIGKRVTKRRQKQQDSGKNDGRNKEKGDTNKNIVSSNQESVNKEYLLDDK